MSAATETLRVEKNVDVKSRDKPDGMQVVGRDGSTTISSGVIAKIAGLAIREVQGVHALLPYNAGQTITSLATRITKNDMRNLGVSVEVGEVECAVDCRIVTEYGVPIHEIANNIRTSLAKRIKQMTGLVLKEANIEVVDLFFGDDDVVDEENPRVR